MKKRISPAEYDIIREVGSICAGNSTLAFSQIIGRGILLEAPHLNVIDLNRAESELDFKEKIVVAVHAQILSGIIGQVSLLFREKSAYEFVSIFASRERQNVGFLTELGVSTIKEIGNVVISAYAAAMGQLLGVSVIPSIPVLSSGPIDEVLRFGFDALKTGESVFVHTMVFKDRGKKISGLFYLMLSPKTAAQISRIMCRQLKQLKKSSVPERRRRHESP